MLSRKRKGGCSKDPFGGQFEDLKCLELNDNEGSDVVEPFGDPKMYFSPLISYEQRTPIKPLHRGIILELLILRIMKIEIKLTAVVIVTLIVIIMTIS